ncbi:hypothetical protein BGZ63DRAFT_424213 [Mariannaea sp. PMI_226]|nr:hypothetical protein BGZ63DRAFT_424213 [Mariannaea sp. PMI_226]
MRFTFRRKNKDKHQKQISQGNSSSEPYFLPKELRAPLPRFPPSYRSAQLLAYLPPIVLERIFAFVCPHSRDESYDTCEGSAATNDSECMLCDLRDLSHCTAVCRAWRPAAIRVLYHSVRIDPVHYCPREAWLAERRKKTHRFDRNGIPEDPAQARLRLLRRTVRDDPTRIGKLVQYLKMPYMLRESSHVELAQTIAVLPNLQYVDLPEGMFCDDPNYATLRLEVQARCPQLRKMTYNGGSERSFAMLASGRVWPHLEVLEINNLQIDPMTIRAVLGSLHNLQAFKVSGMPALTDDVLSSADGLPTLPPLKELVLTDVPRVTIRGLIEYLAWQETQQALTVLTLKETGVHPSHLQEILTMASSLRTLAIQAKVMEQFPNSSSIRPLASRSIETLRYEINAASSGAFSSITTGYYTYLATSIMDGGLPRLRRLYVHDDSFPDQLQGLPPPNAAFAAGHMRSGSNTSVKSAPGFGFSASMNNLAPVAPPRRPMANAPPTHRLSSNNPFASRGPNALPPTHTLEVFTKSDEFGKWNFARVDTVRAVAPSRRPVSHYGLAADVTGTGWSGGDARRSVMVGNGAGGFLAVPNPPSSSNGPGYEPTESWRPHSSGGDSSRDLWR